MPVSEKTLYLTDIANELREDTAWQTTPVALEDADYENMVVQGLKKLYIDTGRASIFDKSSLQKVDIEDELGNISTVLVYEPVSKLLIDEEYYILLMAKINFFKRVQSDVNRLRGYSTNALTVTHADKPYANLADTIAQLENERRITFYKMTRFILPIV